VFPGVGTKVVLQGVLQGVLGWTVGHTEGDDTKARSSSDEPAGPRRW